MPNILHVVWSHVYSLGDFIPYTKHPEDEEKSTRTLKWSWAFTSTDVQKYLLYLYLGFCLLEHFGGNSEENPALKQKVLICIVCLWSPFPQTVSISPISKCPRYQQPSAVQNGGCGKRGLKEHALKEGQSGQFLNNKSVSVLDKWMLRAQKLHLQETLIPYPSLGKDLKYQHLRMLLFP